MSCAIEQEQAQAKRFLVRDSIEDTLQVGWNGLRCASDLGARGWSSAAVFSLLSDASKYRRLESWFRLIFIQNAPS